jgi:predicted amidophosphoribosyltransferase
LTQRTTKNVVPRPYRALVLDALLPLVCPGCGRPGSPGSPVCAACAGRLLRPPPAPPPPGIDAWCAAFAYDGVAREVVARAKYRGARAALPWLAGAMVGVLNPAWPALDVVTWAPTSRARRGHRGFDPAELLARAVARRLRARCVGLLDRRPGPPQTGLAGADRRRGPVFDARRRAPAVVLLVDDVATTGATLAAAAVAIRAAGADIVVAATAARTPPPRAGSG